MTKLNNSSVVKGMGWLPDYPDFRDYTVNTNKLQPKFLNAGEKDSVKKMLSEMNIRDNAKKN